MAERTQRGSYIDYPDYPRKLRLPKFAREILLATSASLIACSPGFDEEARATPTPDSRSIATSVISDVLIGLDGVQGTNPDIQPPAVRATPTAPRLKAMATDESVKEPENILPEYAVFYGKQKKPDGTKGSVIAAHLPGYPNYLYVLEVANRSGGGNLYEIERTDEKSIEAVAGWRVGGVYVTPTASQVELGKKRPKLTMILGEDGKTLSGSYRNDEYQMRIYGTGRAALIDAARRLWAEEIVNDPGAWQKVPEASILEAAFRGIELR